MSYAFSKMGDVELFWDLLIAFKSVRQTIDQMVTRGKPFVLGRPTTVVTIWLKAGIGFVWLKNVLQVCYLNASRLQRGLGPVYIGSLF